MKCQAISTIFAWRRRLLDKGVTFAPPSSRLVRRIPSTLWRCAQVRPGGPSWGDEFSAAIVRDRLVTLVRNMYERSSAPRTAS